MKDLIKKFLEEALILKVNNDKQELIVFSNEKDPKKASAETFKNKEKLKANKLFNWDGDIKAWVAPITNFEQAKAVLNEINKTSEFVGKVEDLEAFVRNSEDFDGKGNLMDKLSLYVQDLANTTDEKAMSAEIRRYLTFFASFKGHSFFNTMLIYIQRPNATKVAGFRQWETKYFRRVKKGAKGIMIFAPVFNKGGQEAPTNNTELDKEVAKGNPIRFRPVYVFDMADTEAIDERGNAPEEVSWFTETEPTERTKELMGYLKQVAEALGINVTNDAANGGEKGYSAGNHINMTSAVEGAGEVSTLVHELAHELMHWKKSSLYFQGDEVRADRAVMELQAESVAYVVMKHFGLPVEHQPTYIALWKGNKDKILANLKVISNVAKFIIDEVDKFAGQKKVDENLYF
jgi:antirestriction protein ArdC